jgi:uncharacterized membrane protein YphA (DoxX/SURF4 family)
MLRAAVGTTSVIQGGAYLADHRNPAFETWGVGLIMAASGLFVLVGLLTPVASVLMALGVVGIALSWFSPPVLNLFNAPLPAVLMIAVACALVFLGPGTASVDRRLFGRREIIIPPHRRPSIP